MAKLRNYVWIGHRDTNSTHFLYEINLIKAGWDPVHGWPTPLESFCKNVVENKIHLKLEPGEVAKLELKLIRE